MPVPSTVTLAFTGASGMPYGVRLVECLIQAGCRVWLLYSQVAQIVARKEMDWNLPARPAEVEAELRAFVDAWQKRGPIPRYWDDHKPDDSLLVSAETVAEHRAMGQHWTHSACATPNSMRDVEAQVQFRMAPVLKRNGGA